MRKSYNTYQNNNATTTLLLALRGSLGAGALELLEDSERFVDLGVHGIGGLEEVEELRVVHFQQHAGDLASELRLGPARG